MQWNIQSVPDPTIKNRETAIITSILNNRGITNSSVKAKFLHPQDPNTIAPETTGIDPKQLTQAIAMINQAIATNQPMIIFGDYDADGITATAIMWETLTALGATAYPFIPSRETHGYGLSIKGLEDALALLPVPCTLTPLLITVDNGIVAHEAIAWAKAKNISIIVTDHHQPGSKMPDADAIVHTTQLCGAGVAWMIAKTLLPEAAQSTLDLACIGTISDMMPLTGANRSMVAFGLTSLRQTHRPGIQALFSEAQISEADPITPYHVNYIIAPRLNAMGRLEHALDSLRLLCTRKPDRAIKLASMLGSTNRNRQDLTQDLLDRAKEQLVNFHVDQKIIVLDDDQFHEGVIGLIAGKLVETHYRPTIIISRKQGISKASARSIMGVNITELIREHGDLLEGVGGHPMAAGFSIKTEKIELFKHAISITASQTINETLLVPTLNIDVQIELEDITESLYQAIEALQPFGIGNPHPIIAFKAAIKTAHTLGKEGKHLKFMLTQDSSDSALPAVWFNHADIDKYPPGTEVMVAGTLNLNSWRGKTSLQLIVKDILNNR